MAYRAGSCVNATYHGTSSRRAVDGALLCRGCLDFLERCLVEMPAAYADLTFALGSAETGADDKVTGTPEARLPVNEAVSDHLREMVREVGSWARLLASEENMTGPADGSVRTGTRWLLAHVGSAARQTWADEFLAAMGDLRSRARSLTDPSHRNRTLAEIGPCPDCDGKLWARISGADDVLPSEVRCSENPVDHVWPNTPLTWLALGRRVLEQQQKAS